MGSGAVVGPRAALRRVAEGDLEAIQAWYEEAAKAAHDDRSLDERRRRVSEANRELLALLRPEDDKPIGLLEYELSKRKGGLLTVKFIALAKAYRGWGYGSEAVRLLEEWAVREGIAERFRAEVDGGNGMGLYFWLRLGYRPDAVPSRRGGEGSIIAMIRDVEAGDEVRSTKFL